MTEKYDMFSYFWIKERNEPDWKKIRRLNTYLTFRQKACALYLLKDKKVKRYPPGKNKLKDIIFNREYRQLDSSGIYLNPYNSSNGELPYLKRFWEDISNQNLDQIPLKYSYLIEITFKLKKPYLSKDDDDFYIIDNPIVKDKVFKLPMVRSTTWKGALRFSAIKVFEDWIRERLNNSEKIDKETVFRERSKIVRLFGNEKDSQESYLGKLCLIAMGKDLPSKKKEIEEINKEFNRWLIDKGMISKDIPSRSGRLFFYPTFFEEISLDVITPLSRETKTPVKGRAPIYFEIVPENTEGIFRLLYYPFDLIARGELDKIDDEIEDDMKFLAKVLKKMFYEIGFSAKKTSGFGTAEVVNVRVSCGERLKDKEKEYEKFMKNKLKNGDSDDK